MGWAKPSRIEAGSSDAFCHEWGTALGWFPGRGSADEHFRSRKDLCILTGVGLSGIGSFDCVLMKHRPISSEIIDFVVIEFQTGQTTATGGLVRALQEFMQGKEVIDRDYGFGLNYADTWKRTFTQVLTKGMVLEKWGHRIYWVLQEPVYQDFLNRYSLNGLGNDPGNSTVFAIYDMKRSAGAYRLSQTRVETTTVDHLFNAFRDNLDIPSKDVFLKRLSQKLKAHMELKLSLDEP